MITTTPSAPPVNAAALAFLGRYRSGLAAELRELVTRRTLQLAVNCGLDCSGSTMLTVIVGYARFGAANVARLEAQRLAHEGKPIPSKAELIASAWLTSFASAWPDKDLSAPLRALHRLLIDRLTDRQAILVEVCKGWRGGLKSDPPYDPSCPDKSFLETYLKQGAAEVAELDSLEHRLAALGRVGKDLDASRVAAVDAMIKLAGGPKALATMVTEVLTITEQPDPDAQRLRGELDRVSADMLVLPEGGRIWGNLAALKDRATAAIRTYFDSAAKARQALVAAKLADVKAGDVAAIAWLGELLAKQPAAFAPELTPAALAACYAVTREQALAIIAAAVEPDLPA